MCGRLSIKYSWPELYALYRDFLDGFDLDPDSDDAKSWKPRFNVPPTVKIPVITWDDGKGQMRLMRWGLVPAWSKEIGKFATFNARSDGCTSKPTYRGAWKAGRRCIVPASSFFEWRKSDKQPFAIGLGNQAPMAFGGLWEEWKQPDGVSLLSCTIITTDANLLMEPIHDRMPLIIPDEAQAKWLGKSAVPPAEAESMLTSLDAKRMAAWPVGKDVGSVRNESPSLVDQVTI